MPFPREQPIDQHDLIAAAEGSLFSDFDDELSNAGYGETRRDFDFTEVPLPGQPLHAGQSHVVATPRPGVQQTVWVWEAGGSWHEDAQVDSLGKVCDQAGTPVGQAAAPQHAPGTCASCGHSTALPAGGFASFCPACGTPQGAVPTVTFPLQPAPQAQPLAPGGAPSAGAPHAGPPAGYNGIRMTGTNKPPVEVPPGLGRVTGDDDFLAFLDKVVAEDAPAPAPDAVTDTVHRLLLWRANRELLRLQLRKLELEVEALSRKDP